MYRPFLEYLETELFERFNLESQPIPPGLERQVSTRGKYRATIESWCYKCPEFRKIRYTYIDGGAASQVFNSVIYPSHCYDLPLLGIDLLSFGKKKIIIVIDFQPLFRDRKYQETYIDPMREVRERYSDIAQNLEMKFYDANQYFSKYLLFAKTDEETVKTRVLDAYKDYIALYWQMLERAQKQIDEGNIQRIAKAQKDYDQYSADRDPASGLFSSYFGREWAERFLYEFLFVDAKPLAVTSKK